VQWPAFRDLDLPRVTIAANTLAAGVKASGEEGGRIYWRDGIRFNSELSSLGHVRLPKNWPVKRHTWCKTSA
jgi:hypothetical protein